MRSDAAECLTQLTKAQFAYVMVSHIEVLREDAVNRVLRTFWLTNR